MSDAVASPCTNVCRMDEASGWCAGCLRTLDEIAGWSMLDDAEKLLIRAQLVARRVQWRRQHATVLDATPGAP